MKNKSLVLTVIIVVLLGTGIYLLNNYVSKQSADENKKSTISGKVTNLNDVTVGTEKGDKAPDFTLKDINGNTVSLSELKGKRVILNFWATTCPYCKIEMPELDKFYKNHKDDVKLLAIDIGEDKSTVNSYLNGKGYSFTILLDNDTKVAMDYKVQFIPMSFFIDKNGIIRSISNGAMTYDEIEQYYKTIEK